MKETEELKDFIDFPTVQIPNHAECTVSIKVPQESDVSNQAVWSHLIFIFLKM